MNRRNFIVVGLCFLSISGYSDTNSASLDKLITNVYLKNSVQQFDADNFEEAYSLSNIALSFSPDSSDALLIKAVSGRSLGSKDSPMDEITSAIILDNWKYYGETTARAYLSKFMYLHGDIDQAYLNLLPFRGKLINNSYFTELFIRISLSVGSVNAAIQSAEDLLRVDPYDNYAQLILASYDTEWFLKATKILSEGDPSGYFSLDVVQYLIRSGSDCGYLSEYYLNRWGEDRFYKISNICNKKDLLPEKLADLYPENIIVNSNELSWLYSQFEDEKSKQIIMDRLNSISLTIEYDIDNDGFNDTEARFTKGKISAFRLDGNHDDKYDYSVKWSKAPISLTVVSDGQTVTYSYQNYPNLINVKKSDKKSSTEYQLIPYKLNLDVIVTPLNMIKDVPHLLKNVSFPDDEILSSFSTKKSKTNKDSNNVSNYTLVGPEETVEKILSSDGVKILERHYKNSVLITAYKDSDGDGVFDTIYKYKDGLLQTISFDANNNGIAEYMQNYEDGLVSSWDFNEDGIIDSRERTKNGIIYREMSSQLDGIFDTSLEINTGN